jgi:hypothetical protein
MKRSIHIPVFVAVLALAIVSGPAASGEKEKKASRFAGEYSGEWTAAIAGGGKHTGTMTLSVGEDGKFKGTEKDNVTGRMANLTGMIKNGNLTMEIAYPDNTYKVEGTVMRTKKGHLTGTLIQYRAQDELLAGIRIDLPPAKDGKEKKESKEEKKETKEGAVEKN